MEEKVVIDWVVALVAAFIGGGLSAIGAWFAIGRQFKIQKTQIEEVARSFFASVIDENILRLENLQSYRSSNAGAVALFDLNMLIANYQMFERNREHLIRLNPEDRKALNNLISQAQTFAFALQSADQERQNADVQSSLPLGQAERAMVDNSREQAQQKVDELFSHLPTLLNELNAARENSSSFRGVPF